MDHDKTWEAPLEPIQKALLPNLISNSHLVGGAMYFSERKIVGGGTLKCNETTIKGADTTADPETKYIGLMICEFSLGNT